MPFCLPLHFLLLPVCNGGPLHHPVPQSIAWCHLSRCLSSLPSVRQGVSVAAGLRVVRHNGSTSCLVTRSFDFRKRTRWRLEGSLATNESPCRGGKRRHFPHADPTLLPFCCKFAKRSRSWYLKFAEGSSRFCECGRSLVDGREKAAAEPSQLAPGRTQNLYFWFCLEYKSVARAPAHFTVE